MDVGLLPQGAFFISSGQKKRSRTRSEIEHAVAPLVDQCVHRQVHEVTGTQQTRRSNEQLKENIESSWCRVWSLIIYPFSFFLFIILNATASGVSGWHGWFLNGAKGSLDSSSERGGGVCRIEQAHKPFRDKWGEARCTE